MIDCQIITILRTLSVLASFSGTSFSVELTAVEQTRYGVTGDRHLKHVTDASHRRIHVAAVGPRADEIAMLCVVNR